MLSTGIPELRSAKDIEYLRMSLALDVKTEQDASRHFEELIYRSLTSWKTILDILARRNLKKRGVNS